MKAPSLILIIFLVCMIFLLVVLEMINARNQRASSLTMERAIAEMAAHKAELEGELKELRRQLAEATRPQPTPATTPEPAVDAVATTTNAPAAKSPQPQPFQARAYVGNDYLGMAWVVPRNIRESGASGEMIYEPVIWIDERSRKAFTQTNIVEREVVRNNSYNQTWAYQQPYWYGYPLWTRPTPDRPIAPPTRPPVILPSPGGGGAWTPVAPPGNGDGRTKRP